MVCTEGFDAPETSFVVMGRPTKSHALYRQCLGRATHPLPGVVDDPALQDDPAARRAAIARSGKPGATVLDFVGNAERFRGHLSDAVRASAAETLAGEGGAVPVEDALRRALAEKRLLDLLGDIDALKEEEEARRRHVVAEASYRKHG
jgi:superfamily II DNA or RNA helicase